MSFGKHKQALWSSLPLALLMAACSGSSPPDVAESAQRRLDAGEPQAAVIELKSALQTNAESAPLRFLLGLALLAQGDGAGAEIELERAVELGLANHERVTVPLARAWQLQRKHELVVARVAGTRLPRPDDDAALRTLVGESLLALNRMDEAAAAAEAALARTPGHAPAVRLQARAWAGAKRPADAIKLIEQHVAAQPGDGDAYKLLGDLRLASSGDRGAAMQAYQAAVRARPGLVEAHETMLMLHLLNQDVAAATRALEAARAAAPREPRLRYFEAQLAFARGDHPAVRERLAPLLQKVPEDLNLLRLAGANELRLGALPQAEQWLREAQARAPALLEIRRLLAETYIASGQPAKALEQLLPSLDAASVDHEAFALAGKAASLLGDRTGALRHYERAAKLRPSDPVLKASVTVARLAQGQRADGVEELRRIAASDNGVQVDVALVNLLMQRRDHAAALKAIESIDRKQPEGALAPELRARVLARQKDLAGARRQFELALQREPRRVQALVGLGEIDAAQGRLTDAKARWKSRVDADPKNIQLRLAMAEFVARHGGGQSELQALFEAAVAADPGAVAPRVALIQHHETWGDAKAALLAAQGAAAAIPTSGELLGRLGQAQLRAGERRQALQSLTQLTQLQPQNIDGHLALADVQMATGDLAAAERAVQRALEIDGESIDALRTQALVALRLKRPDVAVAAARKVQKRMPQNALGLVMEGDVELDRKAFDAAAAAYRKATQTAEPGAAPARLHRALQLARKDSEAAQFAEEWIRKQPADTSFVFYLGDQALVAGRFEQAEQRYRQVLARQPEQAMALNNLAWVLMQQGKAGAVEAARRAASHAPANPAIRDTLGLALARERQFPEALEIQQRLVTSYPDRHDFRLNLARTLVSSGDRKRALAEIEQLERLGDRLPGHGELKRLRERAQAS